MGGLQVGNLSMILQVHLSIRCPRQLKKLYSWNRPELLHEVLSLLVEKCSFWMNAPGSTPMSITGLITKVTILSHVYILYGPRLRVATL